MYKPYMFSSVQLLSCVRLFATPWIAARQASLSITNSQSSLRLNVHRVSDAIQVLKAEAMWSDLFSNGATLTFVLRIYCRKAESLICRLLR